MSAATPPVEIKPAATILLLRDEPAFEVLMLQRHHEIDFASGAMVFPGGKLDPGDHAPAWADHALSWERYPPQDRALRIAAVREAFEEVGILLAREQGGEPFLGAPFSLSLRRSVDAGQVDFLEVVRDLGVKLDLDALDVFARWVTPEQAHKRYDTWFYVAKAPPAQLAACDGREAVGTEWMVPAEALRMGAMRQRKIIFPTEMNLRLLAEATSAADAMTRARGRKVVKVELRRELRPGGEMWVLPPDAGYGVVEVSLSDLMSAEAASGAGGADPTL